MAVFGLPDFETQEEEQDDEEVGVFPLPDRTRTRPKVTLFLAPRRGERGSPRNRQQRSERKDDLGTRRGECSGMEHSERLAHEE